MTAADSETDQPDHPVPRPTLERVAAVAGVGRGTVSRVINGSARVSPRVRAVVEQTIIDLGYVPNRAARTLVTRRTDTVALVVAGRGGPFGNDDMLAPLIRGMAAGLAETPLRLWVVVADASTERDQIGDQLTDQHVDGVLLVSGPDGDPLAESLVRRGLPVVLDRRPTWLSGDDPGGPVGGALDAPVGSVSVDYRSSLAHAIAYLRSVGRQETAMITGSQGWSLPPFFLDPAAIADLVGARTLDPELVETDRRTVGGGAVATRRLLARRPGLSAIIAGSDLMAAGAIRELRRTGRRVPTDVAVIGFGDSSLARGMDPALTSVRIPVRAMGRQMARLLVALIAGERAGRSHLLLETPLVRRASA